MTTYRLLEHTADMGIAARGNSLAELFQAAAEGLRAVLIEAPCDETECQQVSLKAEEPGELLVAWLQEILYRFECSRFLAGRFRITSISETALEATLFGTRFDPRRHPIEREVKAATFHRLQIAKDGDEWVATVYLDL